MQNFQDLAVWQRSHRLVLRIYSLSSTLPASENFGLVLNLRRSSVAMVRSIAEGSGKGSDTEFAQDLRRARAFGFELEYVLLLCRDLKLIDPEIHDEVLAEVIEVRKMLSGLVRRVQG